MGLLDSLFVPPRLQATWNPTDDRWYGPVPGPMTAAGIRVDEEGARMLSAWYRGRDLLATTLAMLPLNVYERLANGSGAQVARMNPLHDVLHSKPNSWQDSYGYRRMKMFHLIDFGNGYDFIRPGARGFADQLWPIHPPLVTPEQLPSKRVIYHVRDEKTGQTKTYTQDDIFHLRGASDDGVVGKGVLRYARENIGIALRVESYAANIFGKGTLNGGWIKVPGVLNDDAGKRMARSFLSAPGEEHIPKVLEQGSEFQPNTLTPEDAQMLLSRKFSVTDIARWLGVPPHMIGDLERSTNNNIEQQGQEFVTYSLGGWLSLFEFSINDQLILNTERFYAEFNRDALVRGDLETRTTANVANVNAGIRTVDEVRAQENWNRRGGKADELRDPANITGKGAKGGPQDNQRPGRTGVPESRAEAITAASASRLLKIEVTAVQKLTVKHGKSQDDFAVAITAFYSSHATRVIEMLLMSEADAAGYCASQASRVMAGWVAALEEFQTEGYAQGLAAWALESEAA